MMVLRCMLLLGFQTYELFLSILFQFITESCRVNLQNDIAAIREKMIIKHRVPQLPAGTEMIGLPFRKVKVLIKLEDISVLEILKQAY